MNFEDLIQCMLEINSGISISDVALKRDVARSTLTGRLKRAFGKKAFQKAKEGLWTNEHDISNNTQKKTEPEKTNEEYKEKFKEIDFYITNVEANVTLNKKLYRIPSDSLIYKPLIDALAKEDYKSIVRLLDKVAVIKEATDYRLEIDNLNLKYDGKNIPKEYINIIKKEFNNGTYDFRNLGKFFSRCHENNLSEDITKQMYEFLKHNDISIDEEGCIIGWKYVSKLMEEKDVFVDTHTLSIKQKVGDTIKMPRSEVDADPNVTCSTGLHVGAWDYVKGNKYIFKVSVKPENVVSVPIDYEGMKLRCCEYTILEMKYNNTSF